MGKSLRASAAALGSRGGRAGTGSSKRRGDSDFYRRLVARRKDRRVSAMEHRHLDHRDFTLAAIDDVIGNGGWDSWMRLRAALRADPQIREKVRRVCEAQAADPAAQRHHFWRNYARDASDAR